MGEGHDPGLIWDRCAVRGLGMPGRPRGPQQPATYRSEAAGGGGPGLHVPVLLLPVYFLVFFVLTIGEEAG